MSHSAPPYVRDILSRYHHPPVAGDQGNARTIRNIQCLYYWPGLPEDVKRYTSIGKVCQRAADCNATRPGLLHLLLIAQDRFRSLSINSFFRDKTVGGLYVSIAADSCMFIKIDNGKLNMVGVFVDDLLIMAESKDQFEAFKRVMEKKFNMTDMGDVKNFLGLQIIRDRNKKTITLAQTAYIQKMLKKYGMDDCASKRTPSSPSDMDNVTTDEAPPESEKEKNVLRGPYRCLLGELQYLAAMTRPDIAESVS